MPEATTYRYEDVAPLDVPEPARDCSLEPVTLTDETIAERKRAVLDRMSARGLDDLVVYADLEHGGNYEYLVGFLPRFEESLLVLHVDGTAHLVLGNENFNKADKARIEVTPVHMPHLSLPNQPMTGAAPVRDVLAEAGLAAGRRVGVAGWKLFTSPFDDNSRLFDVPAYLVEAIRELCGADHVANAADVFLGPAGVRRTNNPNEIAHYEFAASLAGDALLDAMDALVPGASELEVADRLSRCGQRESVITVCAFGPRFVKANVFPTAKRLVAGETVSMSVGYRGGLSSQAGYAVRDASELPASDADWYEAMAAPYFTSVRAWLENARVGMSGGELWGLVDDVLPRETYGWTLCPGHLVAEEEWLCSPVYEGSEEPLEPGMLFEIDIIPSRAGHAGVSCESTCALADAELRARIAEEDPALWSRVERRRAYLADELGIALSDDVLPMSCTLGYLRPFLLSRKAMGVVPAAR